MKDKGSCVWGRYKDVPAVIIENDVFKASFIPEIGGRQASLFYKKKGCELLWQNPSPEHIRPSFGGDYASGEFAGFDEMFPTITSCICKDFPWEGTPMPDHGEVWSLPWKADVTDDELTMEVIGIRFPYILQKKVRAEGNALILSYSLHNSSPFPIPCFYAAHPLFNVDEGDEFFVPEGIKSITNSVAGDDLSAYGREYPYPLCHSDKTGKDIHLNRMPGKSETGYKKYYFTDHVTIGNCGILRYKAGIKLTLTYPADKLPYLGVWMNEGGWENQYNLALEPASASMDDPVSAELWGKGFNLAPFSQYQWDLTLKIEDI